MSLAKYVSASYAVQVQTAYDYGANDPATQPAITEITSAGDSLEVAGYDPAAIAAAIQLQRAP